MDSDWSLVPPKAFSTIVSHLTHKELLESMCVCKNWSEQIKICNDQKLENTGGDEDIKDIDMDDTEGESPEDLIELKEMGYDDDDGDLEMLEGEHVDDACDLEVLEDEKAENKTTNTTGRASGGNWARVAELAKGIPRSEWATEEMTLLIQKGVKYRQMSRRPGLSKEKRDEYILLNKKTRRKLTCLIREEKQKALIRLGLLENIDQFSSNKEQLAARDSKMKEREDSIKLIDIRRIKQEKVDKVKAAWSKLFPRALRTIESYLSLEESINLKLVCKEWNESLQQDIEPDECNIELFDDRVVDLLSDADEDANLDALIVAVIFRYSSEIVVSDRDWEALKREISSWIRRHKDREPPRYEELKEKHKGHRLLKCFDLYSKKTLSEILDSVNLLWVGTSFEVVSKAEIPRKGPFLSLTEINRLITKARRNILLHKGDNPKRLGFDAFCRLSKAWEDIDRYEVIKEKLSLCKEFGVKENPRKHPRKKIPKLHLTQRQLDKVANYYPHTKNVLTLLGELNKKPHLSDDDYDHLKFGSEWLLYYKQKVLDEEKKQKSSGEKKPPDAKGSPSKKDDKSSVTSNQPYKKAVGEKKSDGKGSCSRKDCKSSSSCKQPEKKSLDGKESSNSKQTDMKSLDGKESSTSKKPDNKTLDAKEKNGITKASSSGHPDKRQSDAQKSLQRKEPSVSSTRDDDKPSNSDSRKTLEKKELSSNPSRYPSTHVLAISSSSKSVTTSLDRRDCKQLPSSRNGLERSLNPSESSHQEETVIRTTADWGRMIPNKFWKRVFQYISDRDLLSMSMVCKRWNSYVKAKVQPQVPFKKQIRQAENTVIKFLRKKDPASLTLQKQENFQRSRLLLQSENMFDEDYYRRLASMKPMYRRKFRAKQSKRLEKLKKVEMDTEIQRNSIPSLIHPVDSSAFQVSSDEFWIQGSNGNTQNEFKNPVLGTRSQSMKRSYNDNEPNLQINNGFSTSFRRESRPQFDGRCDGNSNNNPGFDDSRTSFRSNNLSNFEISQNSGSLRDNTSSFSKGFNLVQNSFHKVKKYDKIKFNNQTNNMVSQNQFNDVQTSNKFDFGQGNQIVEAPPNFGGNISNNQFSKTFDYQNTNFDNTSVTRRDFNEPEIDFIHFQNNNFDNQSFETSRNGPRGFGRRPDNARFEQNFDNRSFDQRNNMSGDAPSTLQNTNFENRPFDNQRDGPRKRQAHNYMGNDPTNHFQDNNFSNINFDNSREERDRFDQIMNSEFKTLDNRAFNRRDVPQRFNQQNFGDKTMDIGNRPREFDQQNSRDFGNSRNDHAFNDQQSSNKLYYKNMDFDNSMLGRRDNFQRFDNQNEPRMPYSDNRNFDNRQFNSFGE